MSTEVHKSRTGDGRTRRAEEQRDLRRREVLATALKVFAERGYHETRISDIVTTAGIARGTFYLYFDSKADIFAQLVDNLLDQLRTSVVGVDTGSGTPALSQQLTRTIKRVVRVVEDNDLLLKVLMRQAVGVDSEIDEKLSHFYERLRAFIADALRTGQMLGMVRTPLDADVVASCILGSIKHVMEQEVMSAKGTTDFDLDRWTSAILDFNLRGVLAVEPSEA